MSGVLIPSNSHSPHSPLPTTRTVILVTHGYELDPRSKSRVAAIQIGSFLARVTCTRTLTVIIFVILEIEKTIGLCARIRVRMNPLGGLVEFMTHCVFTCMSGAKSEM